MGIHNGFDEVSPIVSLPGISINPAEGISKEDSVVSKTASSQRLEGIDHAVERAWQEWKSETLQVAERLRARALSSLNSATEYARLAQSEFIAGNSDEACAAALKSIEYASETNAGEMPFDVSSVASALQVLLRTGYEHKAQNWLHYLPENPILNYIRANIAARAGDWDAVLHLLRESESAEAAKLRGYANLQRSNFSTALKEFRLSVRASPDAETYMNMAFALWQLGSQLKALRSAKQAVYLAPGRRDLVYTLIDFLISSGDIEGAVKEFASLKARDATGTPRRFLLEARLAQANNKRGQSIEILRRAASFARDVGDRELEVEAAANAMLLSRLPNVKNREEAKKEIKKGIQEYPDSFVLVHAFSDVLNKKSEAPELEQLIDRRQDRLSDVAALSLNYKLAYLTCDFDLAAALAKDWSNKDHLNPRAAVAELLCTAHVWEDFESAANLATQVTRKFNNDLVVVNNCAYVLALAGRAREAIRVIESVPPSDRTFAMHATAALCQLSLGNIDQGLSLYREAAKKTNEYSDGSDVGQALVTLYETLALRRLGLFGRIEHTELVAKSLPPVDLPDDWADRPDFIILQRIAERNNWPWPLVVQ